MLPAMHRLPLAPLRAVAALKQDLAAAARVVHPRPRRRHASSVACELDRRADDAADAVALVVPHQGVSWSYGELRTKARPNSFLTPPTLRPTPYPTLVEI